MRLFQEPMLREIDEMHRRGVRIVFSGRREDLSPRMRERIDEAVRRTAANTNGVLNVCLNYGGRRAIARPAETPPATSRAARPVPEGPCPPRPPHPHPPPPRHL